MKIVIANWWENNTGGCETFFETLADHFGTKIVTVDDAYKSGVQFINKPHYRNAHIDRSLYVTKYLKDMEAFNAYDLIIANDDIGAAFHELKTPIVSVFQNPYVDLAKIMQAAGRYDIHTADEFRYNYKLSQFVSANISKEIVAVSEFMKEYVAKNFNKDSRVINHGVDETFWKPTDDKANLREKYNIPKDKKVGIFVGRFHAAKYNLVPAIVKAFPDIHWIIVFGQDQVTNFPIYSKNVSVFWKMDKKSMRELYQLSDFYYLPTYCESFNLSALEAASCNLPIVTTKTGYFFEKDRFDAGIATNINENELKGAVSEVTKDLSKFKPREWILNNNLTLKRCMSEWDALIKDLDSKI